MKIPLILVGWVCHFVVAQEKVCSSFCNSLGIAQNNPGNSCKDIYQINKVSRGVSGNYWINTPTGVHQVYCDMELECGGHKGGWMRIAYLDTSRGDNCPSGWSKITTPPSPEVLEVCRASDNRPGCYQAIYSTYGFSYSSVCGMAKGYQKGTPDGFAAIRLFQRGTTISQAYVDGLSIIINNSIPKHIWSFAIGHTINDVRCPCSVMIDNNGSVLIGQEPQQFVKNNYYCDSSNSQSSFLNGNAYYTADPLWDGEGCSGANYCCNEPGMPWFSRHFPSAVSGDIAARICRDQFFADEEILIEQLQLYVQ